MDKINFQDGTKISSAKVTIDEVDYPVTPARYTGATPLSSQVLNTMQTNIENAINQNTDNIGGEEYDETATYEEGDIVKHEGQLYICIEAIDTPEEWDSTKWDVTDVLSSAGGNEVVIGTDADITGKTKIFIDESEGTDAYSEVVNSLSGNEIAKAPSVRAVKEESQIYSTDEIKIGTYLGKTLYRKTFVVPKNDINTTADTDEYRYNISDNISYDKIFIDQSHSAYILSSGNMFQNETKPSNSNYSVSFRGANPQSKFIQLFIGSSIYSSLDTTYITIEYTKTSD